ncbi:MAG: pilus assembly protein [Tyzzerella sp.]|nr:pilus assembly protein [Tyzzerella sp.]
MKAAGRAYIFIKQKRRAGIRAKKAMRGSITIEASVIVPVIFMVFSLVITALFYYHDKNVVASVAHETVVMGSGKEENSAEELESYFRQRIRKKLILFSSITPEVAVEEEEIQIICKGRKSGMSMRVQMQVKKTEPEKFVRKLKSIERIEEGLGESK